MRQAKYRFFLLPLFLILASVAVWAQANSEVTGIVTDQTGAVVAGAKIVLTDPATGESHTTVSGGTGLYDFSGLNPANYNMKITAKGFESFAQNGIVVNVSSTARADVKLTVGAESQTVTVEADALAVQADSNVVSTLINSEQISEIATENRNFAALAALGLGVSSALPDSNTPTSVAASFTISVNGLRQSHNIWLIDGGEADDRGGAGGMDIMPSQDAIAEFTMLTSNYPPDYGISSGATMSLSLKSGTQKFHGEAYEFNRNTDYDANQYFNKLNGTPRTSTHYNIFGVNAGGPVFIPHVYNSNRQKTFFFWNEEWRKILSGAGTNEQNTIDPLDLPKAGTDLVYTAPTFSPGNKLVVPNIPMTDAYYINQLAPRGLVPNMPFPGNKIPNGLFDNNGILYLNSGVLPAPNVPGQDKNITNVSNPIDVTDTVIRIDHKFNDKWQILGHYMEDQVNQGYAQPELGWLWASYNTITSTLQNPSDSAAIKLSGTITPNLLVESSINYDGNVINITNSANSQLPSGWNVTPVASSFKITRNSLPGMGYFGPYGTAEDTGSAPWHNAARDFEPKADISYTQGKHAMKFGFSVNHYTKNQQLFGDEQGNYSPSGTTNDSLMDLLLGLTGSYSQFQAVPIRHYVNNTTSAYVMDNWHTTPRLTLQLGIRYDALPHAWERNNEVANFNPANYNPSATPQWTSNGNAMLATSPGLGTVNSVQYYLNGMGLAGVQGFPRGLVENDYNTVQPRVGFSEDMFGNGKTVLRGGFGTFFERLQGNDIYNAATNPPFAYNLGVGSTLLSSPGISWVDGSNVAANGFPITPAGVTNLEQNYKAPAVAQFSLGVQHEIKPSIVWVVQYVGNLAWHQNIEKQLNNMTPALGAMTSVVPNDFAGADGPATVTATNSCLAGDSGNHYGTTLADVGTYDANCHHGFASFAGGFNQFREYQGYGGITQEENDTNGSYNGFQTGLRLQNKWGLSGELDYTYSHEIDVTSYDLSGVSNPWNLKYDKGSGALDRRQIVNANYVYKLPFFAKGNSLAHSLIGGWEVAGTVIDESGVIATVTGAGGVEGSNNGVDPVGLGGGYTVRPNVSGKMTYAHNRANWFNTAAFSNPVPEWLGGANLGFGNAGKDAVVGPGRVNFTTSLYKSFAVTERAHFELRFESFNTFNHSEFNGLNTSYNPQNACVDGQSNCTYPGFSNTFNKGDTFGQVSSAWDSRVLELGGKFVF